MVYICAVHAAIVSVGTDRWQIILMKQEDGCVPPEDAQLFAVLWYPFSRVRTEKPVAFADRRFAAHDLHGDNLPADSPVIMPWYVQVIYCWSVGRDTPVNLNISRSMYLVVGRRT